MDNDNFYIKTLSDKNGNELVTATVLLDEGGKPFGLYHYEIKLYDKDGRVHTIAQQGNDMMRKGCRFDFFNRTVFYPNGEIYFKETSYCNGNQMHNQAETFFKDDKEEARSVELYYENEEDESECSFNYLNGEEIISLPEHIKEEMSKYKYLIEESNILLDEYDKKGYIVSLIPEVL